MILGAAGIPEEGPIWTVVVIFAVLAAVVGYVIWQFVKQRKR